MDENNSMSYQSAEVPKKKKKKKGTAIKVIFIILLCFIIGIVLAVGGQTLYNKYQSGGLKAVFDFNSTFSDTAPSSKSSEENDIAIIPEDDDVPVDKKDSKQAEIADSNRENDEKDTTSTPKIPFSNTTSDTLSAAELYEENVDAMVSISVGITGYNAWGQRVEGAAAGSGFIVSPEGFILTNYHVIEDSNTITVYLYDGDSYDAQVIGYDVSNDIAVLKINGDNDFQTVVIGDSDKCKVGEEVVAIGNSLGEFGFSITRGIISGLARNVTISSNLTMSLIQTDCTINSGNSGGALFNMKGEVIGITNAKYSSSGSSTSAAIENVGFAIPMKSVEQIVQAIVSGEKFVSPYIGVSVTDVSTDVANATGLNGGAYIAEIVSGGPAEKAGVKVGDIITSVNGQDITSYQDLSNYISSCKVGDVLSTEIYRRGKNITLEITVGEREDTNVVMGDALEEENEKRDQEQAEYENQQNGNYYQYGNEYGNDNGNYYGGYGSMPDIFSHIFGNMYGY